MNAPTTTKMAMAGGAAAFAITFGLGSAPPANTPMPAAHPTVSVAPTSASHAGSGGVQAVTLTGCVAGANC